MEAVLLQSSNSENQHHHHQSIAVNRNRYIQNPNIMSRSSENFSPYPNIHGGGGGGATYQSVPSYYSSVPIINQKQPPLLPLPILTKKPYASLPLIPIRPNNNNYNNKPNLPPVSSSPIRKNNNRSSSTRDQPDHNLYSSKKKSKSSSVIISPKKQSTTPSNFVISSKRLGPEPCDIPKQVSKVMKQQQQQPMAVKDMDIDEEFTGLIFALAPPPSSLPLPKFSMRPRLSCNAEAAGIDNGATDNLCRMLRLR